ncbi:MAG: molybdenum cofactor guanylyltransferase [Microthrixaceae bacterium]
MARSTGATTGRSGSNVSAVILAGGKSRRFGSDKTVATVNGRRVLDLVVEAASKHTDDVLVIGPWAPDGVSHIVETDSSQGPLNALAFAFGQVLYPRVLLLGGDHPLLSHALLSHLTRDDHRSDAVVPRLATRGQPLVACYRKEVAETARGLVASGERRLMALLDNIHVRWMEESEWRGLDPEGLSFMDVDTPDDLEEVRRVWDLGSDPFEPGWVKPTEG